MTGLLFQELIITITSAMLVALAVALTLGQHSVKK
jgi:multidrug efflux pump subunit AcrB